MNRPLFDRIKAVIKPETVESMGLICPDCGIDLPTNWHWDGCMSGKTLAVGDVLVDGKITHPKPTRVVDAWS